MSTKAARATPRSPRPRRLQAFLAGALLAAAPAAALAAERVAFVDFREGPHGWIGNLHVGSLEPTGEGLRITSTGNDPWIESPSALRFGDPSAPHRITVRVRTESDRAMEFFWGDPFHPERSARVIAARAGEWAEYSVVVPEFVPEGRLRFDPSTSEGATEVAWIAIDQLPVVEGPALAAPSFPDGPAEAAVAGGRVRIEHTGASWGAFRVLGGDTLLGAGSDADLLGVVVGGEVAWLAFADAGFALAEEDDALVETARFAFGDGGDATIRRAFRRSADGLAMEARMTITSDSGAEILHLPWLTLFPGLGEESFGPRKQQALLSGVEYLADEPSSSKAAIRTAAHDRRVPPPHHLTWPLMAIAAEGRTLGLEWTPGPLVQPIFDTPDRTHESGAHLFALWAPAVGERRLERGLLAFEPFPIAPGGSAEARARLFSTTGETVVPAIQHAYRLRGGAPGAPPAPPLQEALELLAAGWLESGLRGPDDAHWRHALWPGFGPAPGADVPVFLFYKAALSEDQALAERLAATARDYYATFGMGPDSIDRWLRSRLGHVPNQAPELFYFGWARSLRQREALLAEPSPLAAFREDGSIPYIRNPERPDYAETHWADHVNGMAGAHMVKSLQHILSSGDREGLDRAIAVLDRMTATYGATVPRGAQPWEIPLNTPDILASAALANAYAMAFQLTGEQRFLDEAVHWAWTGLPFVYFEPPTDGDTGLYATIAVLGATDWIAPHWIGLPVQWCGLVYADALHRLAALDDSADWGAIARGIAVSGLQQTFPLSDARRQGLLPDFFHLEAQVPDGPPINPGTLTALLPAAYDPGWRFDSVARCGATGAVLHALGPVGILESTPTEMIAELGGFPGNATSRIRLHFHPGTLTSVGIRPAGSDEEFQLLPFRHDEESGIAFTAFAGHVEMRLRFDEEDPPPMPYF